jgi:two-component system chemotaxis sensor kinase CheA
LSVLSKNKMENYLELFISELGEYIKQLNKQLLNLESNNHDTKSIIEVFRIFHTIKGMAQTMGYEGLSDLSHAIEDLLGDAKDKGETGPNLIDFLFVTTDLLAKTKAALQNRKELPPVSDVLNAISKIKRGEALVYQKEELGAKDIGEIRIRMEKLDTLFNLANELTITRSRLIKLSEAWDDTNLRTLADTASRLISSLQDEVMRLRMLPLKTVFEFFPRWFRDEAKHLGKKVSLEIVGGNIEVDRSIIDILKEPLMHLIRNALDHGIETSSSDQKISTVVLKATREKERIVISVVDNGKGIDLDKVRNKAVKSGLISETEAQHFGDEELYQLLTHPVFSTKDEVTTISGRGIGLDIVNTTVNKLGGKLVISSRLGEGSSFTLELPLSLAIIRAMVFNLDGQRFALPLNYIQETFYAHEDMFQSVYHHELFPLRDEILPLVRLSDRLGCTGKKGRKSVIVVQTQGKRRGFVTDEIIDEEEIVVKKLDPLFAVPVYSGCSIYADGLPILILDPRGFG